MLSDDSENISSFFPLRDSDAVDIRVKSTSQSLFDEQGPESVEPILLCVRGELIRLGVFCETC